MDAPTLQGTFADLRAFFTIGFQDLWLRKHNIPREYLFMRLVSMAMEKNIGLLAITSEDDRMLESSSEDRLRYLMNVPHNHPYSQIYQRERLDENLLRVERKEDGRKLLLLNSETIHSPPGVNWEGLKIHVLGANRLRKEYLLITDVAEAHNNQGLLTFLTGITSQNASSRVTDWVTKLCYGVITHDANNTFYPWLGNIPAFQKYTTRSNQFASQLAHGLNKPGIAVSSAHFPHQLGRAGITLPETIPALQELKTTAHVLDNIRYCLNRRMHTHCNGYSRMRDVIKFGNLLNTYGRDPQRFVGDPQSSYNRKEEAQTEDSIDDLNRLKHPPFF